MPYTTQEIFPAHAGNYPPGKKVRLAIEAGADDVAIAFESDAGTFVDLDEGPWTGTKTFVLEVGGGRWRVTPSGAAQYSWIEIN